MINAEGAVQFQALTVGSTVVKMPDVPGDRATVTVETAAIRVRWDGGSPASGAGGGHLWNVGDTFMLEGRTNVQACRFIADTSTAATVNITLERL